MRMVSIRERSWSAIEAAEDDIVVADVKMRALATICLSLERKKLAEVFKDSGLIRKIEVLYTLTSIRVVHD